MLENFKELDKKSKEFKNHKDNEKRVQLELDAIKKRERLEEAKRLERIMMYKRQKEDEEYQKERSMFYLIPSVLNSKCHTQITQ